MYEWMNSYFHQRLFGVKFTGLRNKLLVVEIDNKMLRTCLECSHKATPEGAWNYFS